MKFSTKIIFPLLISISIFSCKNKPALSPEKIKRELDSIMILDQQRKSLNSIYTDFGEESNEFQKALKKQLSIDSSNLVYVENLIAEYGGYPGKSFVGSSTGEVAFFVLQHSPDSIQAKYIDLILKASENNELKKGSVAMFHDRYLIGIGEPQIYGTQIGFKESIDSITGEKKRVNYLYPIRDTVNIDSVRLWNGLVPFEKYLNSFGLSRWE